MTLKLARDSRPPDPAAGLLRAEHFQMAYVTNDMAHARDLFSMRLGIREFATVGGQYPAGGFIRAELAWVGPLMYELVEARGPGSEIFSARLADTDDFQLIHHHLGFLIHDRAQWDALFVEAERQGWDVPHRSDNSLMEATFIAVPELPHYLEYLFAKPAGLDFFAGVPRH